MKKVLLVCAVGLLLAADKDDAKNDLDKFQGTWAFTSHEADGNAAPDDVVKSLTITFAGDKFTVKQGDRVDQAGTNKLDGSKKPKQVDATVTEGEHKGSTMLGIYELSGDTMKFCFDPQGKERPTEFKSKAGSGQFSGTL